MAKTTPITSQPVQCRIEIDGQEITDLYGLLTRVSVDLSRTAAGVCELTFRSLRDATGRWTVQDHKLIAPWFKLRVEAWFGRHVEEVMRGYIKEVRANYPSEMGEASVTVVAQDESILLDREDLQDSFSSSQQPQCDGDIVRRVAGAAGFKIDAQNGLRNTAVHHSGTAIQLLLDRAEANGFELLFRAGRVYFGPPQLNAAAQPTILVYAGADSNCVNLSVRHDGHQPDEVRLVSASDTGQRTVRDSFSPKQSPMGAQATGSGQRGLKPFSWKMPVAWGATLAEQRARAQARADEEAWKVSAEGELDGELYGHVLLTHAPVLLDGIGPTYSGLWYVDAVRHEFSEEGYRQSFRLIRNATGEQFPPQRPDSLAEVRS